MCTPSKIKLFVHYYDLMTTIILFIYLLNYHSTEDNVENKKFRIYCEYLLY